MDPADRLQRFIDERRIDADLHRYEDPVHSVEAAARAADADPSQFVKSLCLIAGDEVVVAVVRGPDRADLERIADLLGADGVRMAEPDEVQEATGYPVGGVPPFGFDAPFLVDEAVVEMDRTWAGGGSDRALVQTTPDAIVEATGATVARLRA